MAAGRGSGRDVISKAGRRSTNRGAGGIEEPQATGGG